MVFCHLLYSLSIQDLYGCRIGDIEFTRECAIFDLVDILLYHGWIVDPQVCSFTFWLLLHIRRLTNKYLGPHTNFPIARFMIFSCNLFFHML